MTVFIGYALIAILVAGLICYGVIALLPDGLTLRPERDRPVFELPADRRMVRADLDRIRIPVTLRGYRFAETDDLIDRLAAELVVRDEEIARLRASGAAESAPRDAGDASDSQDEANHADAGRPRIEDRRDV